MYNLIHSLFIIHYSNSKEDNVNSVISSITVHTAEPTNQIVETETLYNITTYFPYLEVNIPYNHSAYC